jgi:hypothetical protein
VAFIAAFTINWVFVAEEIGHLKYVTVLGPIILVLHTHKNMSPHDGWSLSPLDIVNGCINREHLSFVEEADAIDFIPRPVNMHVVGVDASDSFERKE